MNKLFGEKSMAKAMLRNFDHLMRHLEQSEAFTRLLEKVAMIFGFKEKIIEVDKLKVVVNDVTPQWAKSLEEYQLMLPTIRQHPQLNKALLPNLQAGDELVTLLANLAQWETVLRIWDELAAKAKQGQDISSAEQMILEASLRLFNRSLQDHQGKMQSSQSGTAFDYNVHQSIDGKGSTIGQQILPGLINPGGKLLRKTLVRTV